MTKQLNFFSKSLNDKDNIDVNGRKKPDIKRQTIKNQEIVRNENVSYINLPLFASYRFLIFFFINLRKENLLLENKNPKFKPFETNSITSFFLIRNFFRSLEQKKDDLINTKKYHVSVSSQMMRLEIVGAYVKKNCLLISSYTFTFFITIHL